MLPSFGANCSEVERSNVVDTVVGCIVVAGAVDSGILVGNGRRLY